jgi:hypothetical protein
MMSNVLLHATKYSDVKKPFESGVYEYHLDFYAEGIKAEQSIGATVKAFLYMKSLYSEEQFDIISSITVFQFLTNDLTDKDILWMFNASYEELRSYPKAEEEDIVELLNRFPAVTNETAKFNMDLKKWFYENK